MCIWQRLKFWETRFGGRYAIDVGKSRDESGSDIGEMTGGSSQLDYSLDTIFQETLPLFPSSMWFRLISTVFHYAPSASPMTR